MSQDAVAHRCALSTHCSGRPHPDSRTRHTRSRPDRLGNLGPRDVGRPYPAHGARRRQLAISGRAQQLRALIAAGHGPSPPAPACFRTMRNRSFRHDLRSSAANLGITITELGHNQADREYPNRGSPYVPAGLRSSAPYCPSPVQFRIELALWNQGGVAKWNASSLRCSPSRQHCCHRPRTLAHRERRPKQPVTSPSGVTGDAEATGRGTQDGPPAGDAPHGQSDHPILRRTQERGYRAFAVVIIVAALAAVLTSRLPDAGGIAHAASPKPDASAQLDVHAQRQILEQTRLAQVDPGPQRHRFAGSSNQTMQTKLYQAHVNLACSCWRIRHSRKPTSGFGKPCGLPRR